MVTFRTPLFSKLLFFRIKDRNKMRNRATNSFLDDLASRYAEPEEVIPKKKKTKKRKAKQTNNSKRKKRKLT
jgi:hypothetical protein